MRLNPLHLDPRGLRAELQRQQAEHSPAVAGLLGRAAAALREAAGPAPQTDEEGAA